MFTHQNVAVWADLALIIWAAGLRVTAAWTIATETDTALKQGNYVQGTVLLALRKQTSNESAFEDEIRFNIETEVKKQLDTMLSLDDKEDPNFGDTDYQLAAYAAALRVLTQYRNIEDFDIEYELSKQRQPGEKSPIENIIEDAVKVACSYLVPSSFNEMTWKMLTPEERFYLKGLELESHGEFRAGAYQELAKGFGLREYTYFLASSKANQVRLKNPMEFGIKALGNENFGSSPVRHALFAIREAHRSESAQTGKNWLRNEFKDYWSQRKNLIEILNYLAGMENKCDFWSNCGKAARLVAGAVENDHA
jgi:adenine-specific DNA methylase